MCLRNLPEHELPKNSGLSFDLQTEVNLCGYAANLVNPKTGRIHTSCNQAGGDRRALVFDPHLNYVPVRTEEGRKIAKAFGAGRRLCVVAADYSQIELRIMAHVSGDERLTAAFSAGEDIHAITAASVFDCSPAHVTPEMRRKAKAINFGIMYGMGAFKLAGQIGVGMKMAKQYLEDYYQTYAGVRRYMEKCWRELPKMATTTVWGETLLPDLNNPNRIAQQAA
jgi:DNA polymerase-1